MERSYRGVVYIFIGMFVIVFIGFYKTYFGLFPSFNGVDAFHHFHALAMTTWLIMLIIQPILIRKGNFALHRLLGRMSYFLIPIVVGSMLYAYRIQYFKMSNFGAPKSETLSMLFLPFTDVVPFFICYVLAIINKKNIPAHMRYMIATALVVLSAGLVRMFIRLLTTDVSTTFNISTATLFLFFILFIFYDRWKGRAMTNNPMTFAFLLFLIPNVLNFIVPQSRWWQDLAAAFLDKI